MVCENKASGVLLPPVCPICQRTSAWRIWATWRGIARSRRRLEWRPVACQKPEPSDRLVRRKGRDDCHDCHFCVRVLALHGAVGSAASGTEEKSLLRVPDRPLQRHDPIHNCPILGLLSFGFQHLSTDRNWAALRQIENKYACPHDKHKI